MGLDIVAYSKVGGFLCENAPCRTTEKDTAYITVHDCFYNQHDDLSKGIHVIPNSTEAYDFRAGSYGGYNSWRNELCKLLYDVSQRDFCQFFSDKFRGKPFSELLYFSDCEGTIGPQTSHKLYKDFLEFNDLVQELTYGAYFQEIYRKFRKAFHVSSKTGILNFG